MLPYNNTGKYHETPEGIPMLHTIDHSLTETMFSLSPSSQFMYEQEGLESVTCGQSQGFAGPPVLDMASGDECVKSEGIISPSMEGMTFQDCVELDGLFGPSTDGLGFKDCFELDGNFAPSVSGISFEGTHDKSDGMFCMPGDGLEFEDCGKMGQAYRKPHEGVSFADGRKESGGGFDVLSDALSFENCSKLDELIPATTTSDAEALDRLTNDWFKENDIFEMPKESDELMQDSVFGGGPTLTQLNSKDLDSAFLDEYKILQDLYSSSAAFTGVSPNTAATSLEPALTVSSKFLPGTPGIGPTTSPKFTTCTVTSFVTTVSTAGMSAPMRFPSFVANELFTSGSQETRYLGSSPQERKPEIGVLDRLTELITPGVPLASTYANQCFVPMLTGAGGTQAVRLVGTVVVPAVSVMVSEEAPKPALALPELSMDEKKSVKRTPEQNWEIEHYVQPAESRATAAAECSHGKRSLDVAFNPSEELSDREESMLEDSDIENTVFDNSDEESVISKSEHRDDFTASSRKEKKYFWQYNTQSKGPKGKRLCKSVETEDPHVLHDFEDPVFDPEQNQTRYKHNGKARRGDGNDVTPNPHKLYVTGNELRKLNKLINDITPSSDMPASARAKMLKEKNKFASRACRLKKKAQHEANKLKLHGLELEHRQLMKVLTSIKREIFHRVNGKTVPLNESLSNKLESLVQQQITLNVAGHTADYVNLVLQKVAKGDRTGGITVDD